MSEDEDKNEGKNFFSASTIFCSPFFCYFVVLFLLNSSNFHDRHLLHNNQKQCFIYFHC